MNVFFLSIFLFFFNMFIIGADKIIYPNSKFNAGLGIKITNNFSFGGKGSDNLINDKENKKNVYDEFIIFLEEAKEFKEKEDLKAFYFDESYKDKIKFMWDNNREELDILNYSLNHHKLNMAKQDIFKYKKIVEIYKHLEIINFGSFKGQNNLVNLFKNFLLKFFQKKDELIENEKSCSFCTIF